ncbi:MAG: hypothetical protein D6803_01515 [Anaerolineae bacterium]|nr:MAG: hypothetical protein D6803_01515 [Anaerolineae bacterium]
MQENLVNDPLEGKGEEMVPERGIPFEEVETAPEGEESPAAEMTVPPEGESDVGGVSAEAQPVPPPEAETWDTEAEAVVADLDEEGETVDLDEMAESPPVEDRALPGPPDEPVIYEETDIPPEDMPDEGMGTYREDDAEVLARLFSEPAMMAPGPTPSPGEGEPVPDEPADEDLLKVLVPLKDLQALWQRARAAEEQIPALITTDYIATRLLDQIQAARNLLMAGRDNYEEAARLVGEVEFRLKLATDLKQLGRSAIPMLYAYLGLWFVGLLFALFRLGDAAFQINGSFIVIMAGCMIWGGVGGVVGALLPLIKHFSVEQDYSTQHTWWYLSSPLIGAVLGAFTYLLLSAGVLSLSSGDLSSPLVMYILAGLTGYQHNVFTDLVKRVLKVFSVEEENTDE